MWQYIEWLLTQTYMFIPFFLFDFLRNRRKKYFSFSPFLPLFSFRSNDLIVNNIGVGGIEKEKNDKCSWLIQHLLITIISFLQSCLHWNILWLYLSFVNLNLLYAWIFLFIWTTLYVIIEGSISGGNRTYVLI